MTGFHVFNRFRLGICIAAALLGSAAAAGLMLAAGAEAPQSTETQQDASLRQVVERELPRLGSDSRADRISAEERLLEAGPGVLEWLPPPDNFADAAARDAVRRIRTELERQSAARSLEPGRVTLQGMMSLAEVVERISAQTGNVVVVRSDDAIGDARIAVDYDDVRFWDALGELASNRGLQAMVEQQTLVLTAGAGDQALGRSTAGAFRVEALGIRRRAGIVGVELSITPEPRLRPLFLSWSDADFTAHTSAGELTPLSPDAQRDLPAVDRGPVRFSVVFEDTENKTQPIEAVSVAGSLVVTTAARTQEFRFRDLTEPGTEAHRNGGVSVTRGRVEFSTTRKGIRRAEIELRVVYDAAGPAFESHRTWVYHNEVYLETPDGARLPVNDGFTTLGEQDGAVAVRYQFRDLPDVPPEDLQLVYHAPTAVIEVPVEFELEQLPVSVEP